MTQPTNDAPDALDYHDQVSQRRAKLEQLREQGQAYPNGITPDTRVGEVLAEFSGADKETVEAAARRVTLCGRMMQRRLMGKASFTHIQDRGERLQLYIKSQDVGEDIYEAFKHWDLGDVVYAEGELFVTKTGELSVRCDKIQLLVKSLHPMPDKFHGLADQEMRYRQRYLDLLVNPESRQVFTIRTALIQALREFLIEHQFLEVETPMMQQIPGGAAARAFETHHNALDMPLYLRIAPELYLKRLIVGGLDRVFEINRNFRNEGISTRHNPEFTMVEFYQAYADYSHLIDFTEKLMIFLADKVLGSQQLSYQGHEIDLSQSFARMTVKEAILHYNSELAETDLASEEAIRAAAAKHDISLPDPSTGAGLGKLQMEWFEKTVEKQLIQPTFITAYPTEVSPLARCNDDDPSVTDRFEFFMAGYEVGNGFSELNDPDDQAARFQAQVDAREAGDQEAMFYDADYVKALEYGMPPTAGEGLGIDRLTMVFSDSASIRDVILFPLLRAADG